MSLESRLKDGFTAVGIDMKVIFGRLTNTPIIVEYTAANATRPSGAKQVSWVWKGTGTAVDPTNAVFPDYISLP